MDLALAKELKQMDIEDGESIKNKKAGDYLVLHLSDLVRMGFMGMISNFLITIGYSFGLKNFIS